jgi:hypothetical protein
MSAGAQSTADSCKPAAVIPLADSEPPAKIVIDPPLPGPLASRGVAVIQYCAQDLHVPPVFGPNALAVSPRVGHIHVRIDNAPWVWADTSGQPITLMSLPRGPHKVLIGSSPGLPANCFWKFLFEVPYNCRIESLCRV